MRTVKWSGAPACSCLQESTSNNAVKATLPTYLFVSIHSVTYSLDRTPIHILTRSHTHPLAHSIAHPSTYSLDRTPIHLQIQSLSLSVRPLFRGLTDFSYILVESLYQFGTSLMIINFFHFISPFFRLLSCHSPSVLSLYFILCKPVSSCAYVFGPWIKFRIFKI